MIEDLYTGGLIKRYTKRPASLEHLTLADWAAWYDRETKSNVKPSTELDSDNLQLENTIDRLNDNTPPCENKTLTRTGKELRLALFQVRGFINKVSLRNIIVNLFCSLLLVEMKKKIQVW